MECNGGFNYNDLFGIEKLEEMKLKKIVKLFRNRELLVENDDLESTRRCLTFLVPLNNHKHSLDVSGACR